MFECLLETPTRVEYTFLLRSDVGIGHEHRLYTSRHRVRAHTHLHERLIGINVRGQMHVQVALGGRLTRDRLVAQ